MNFKSNCIVYHCTEKKQEDNSEWLAVMQAVVSIESFDGDRILEKGQGFFVEEDF